MKAALLTLITAALLLAQQPPSNKQEAPEPPEEDLSLSEQKVYVLNPLQAAKEMKIGAFYMKKGSYKAAARRFEEATRWDPNSGEAFLRLGEAQEKLGDHKASHQAWEQFLKLQPDSKQAGEIRKKLAKKT